MARKRQTADEMIDEFNLLRPAERKMKPAKRKTLGQICYEDYWYDCPDMQWNNSTTRERWERVAAAVQMEVLRRWGLLEADKPKAKKGKS